MKLHVICRYVNCVGYCVADISSERSSQNTQYHYYYYTRITSQNYRSPAKLLMVPNRPSNSTAHPANDDDDNFTNTVSAPSRSELTAMLKKPSIGGTIKQKNDFIKRAILIHRHAIQRIITSHLPQIEYEHIPIVQGEITRFLSGSRYPVHFLI